MELVTTVKETYPKTWKYFIEFLEENYTSTVSLLSFEELPFEFQLGTYIAFFNSVSTDVELYSTDIDVLQEAVKDAFAQYEEYLFLDS